jgi:BirA family biotin operon repressor/biotin-[acetyl-CoA-carboxylase] ligase
MLKWPNDLLLDRAKFSGILIESVAAGAAAHAVVGIGVNLAHHPQDLDRRTTSLAAHGATVTCEDALAALDVAMFARIAQWDSGRGFAGTRRDWLKRATAPGEPVSVSMGGDRAEGAFLGLDDDGALLISAASGTKRRITFGDVMLAREQTVSR